MRSEQNSFYLIQYFKRSLIIIFSLLIFSSSVFSQVVDTSFNAVPSSVAFPTSTQFTVQPDGKIIIYGTFQIVQGVQKNGIARLNQDGSLDNSFDCAACDFGIATALVQADGKIMVGGTQGPGLGNSPRLRRLNADGSLDNSFTSPFNEQPSQVFTQASTVWAVQPDGKIFVSLDLNVPDSPERYLHRLNPNGSFDTSFASLTFRFPSGTRHVLADLKLLPDGKLLIGGAHYFGFLFRVNSDGTQDTSFQSPVLTSSLPESTPWVVSFDIQADGKIPFSGIFSAVNNVSKDGFARLNADQSLDSSYTMPLSTSAFGLLFKYVKLNADGKLLVNGEFAGGKSLVRLNPDGSLDNTFNLPANISSVKSWAPDASGKILASAWFLGAGERVVRLNADGSLDTNFNISFQAGGMIYSTAVQTDGKILITGSFRLVNNVSCWTIARLNADGSLDNTFNPGSGFAGQVSKLVVQPDGKILAIGGFYAYNETQRNGFARLNADGSLDTGFVPFTNNFPTSGLIQTVAVQPDGKILVGGSFTSVNGSGRTGIARLNANGSLDNSFNPILGGTNLVREILVQPDGKIMIGGTFATVNGVGRENLARLNQNGTPDNTFNAGSVSNSIYYLAQQPDGKYLVSNGNIVFRRNADGTPDTSFQSVDFQNQFYIQAMLLQADGSILVGGRFTRVNNIPRPYLIRLKRNGSLDTIFLPEGANAQVWTLSKQADNKVIVGGDFTTIGGISRFRVARLNYVPVVAKTPFDYDGDGRADVSVFRPSSGHWYISQSTLGFRATQFGTNGDLIAPADYDGDGKADTAVYRPSTGYWYILHSLDSSFRATQFGVAEDIPVAGDYDGDGQADISVYRPSNNHFYILQSSDGSFHFQQWGQSGDMPMMGDYDGDNKTDYAIFRPSNAVFYVLRSSDGVVIGQQFGQSGDKPIAGDFDGDGKTDIGVYRPSTGSWYYLQSMDNGFRGVVWGTSGDIPSAADYDGDGKWDVAVFRPSSGIWYLLQTTAGFSDVQWGVSGDIPTENAFIP
jgi:uncharacterized delta-60 repeat protein